jgi:ubiquitin-protein ligase
MSLNKITIQRLTSDIKFLLNNPLENIYYKHSEESILKGYALIIGNSNTPYNYGNFLFEFNFPQDYPFNPPKVKYLTNDGKMRFNPNLYSDGKVCLSILNTWKGEGWTSSQTIYSILIILSSILNETPLLNEPGITSSNNNIIPYNLLINYKTIEFSIIKQINFILNNNTNTYNNILLLFKDIIFENFKNNINNIINNINDLEKKLIPYNNIINIEIYNLNYNLSINILRNNLNKIKI